MSTTSAFRFAPVLVLGLMAVGCASMTPGELSRVQPTSDAPRVGNVYLLRGFIGIWSYGVDHLGERINAEGIRANVYQDDQWKQLSQTLIDRYSNATDREPLILIGHSYGADDVLRVARRLEERNIPVDLVVTLDPVTPPRVPRSVRLCYNIYQPSLLDSLPFFRGIPLESELADGSNLRNVNIRAERRDLLESNTDHFNIEKNVRIHEEIVIRLKDVCRPRELWAAQHPPIRHATAIKASITPVPVRPQALGSPRPTNLEPDLRRIP